jgi:hypothetical protein
MSRGNFRTTGILHDPRSKGGPRGHSNDGPDSHKYLWAGVITYVDTETMVCSVRLDTGEGERHDVPLPASGGGGPRSWSGITPERGSKVILGWKKYSNRAYSPYIVEFLTSGVHPARHYEPFSSVDPSEAEAALDLFPDMEDDPNVNLGIVRLKLRKTYSGDYLASSSGGSDILLDRDFQASNRAGNEIRLRDSDQTFVVQSLNEFNNNSAGFYRRGLIKRSSFNILPDMFGRDNSSDVDNTGFFGDGINKSIPINSPAYQKLFQLGLINKEGVPNFITDPNEYGWTGFPYSVLPDGRRTSFITPGDHSFSFSETDLCYVEDRSEIRHASDGIMSVTEEGDGVQIDKSNESVYIEDVKGTVVGNDPYSDEGRKLYKQILRMRVFDDHEQSSPSTGPKLEPIDLVQNHTQSDSIALSRLFRMRSPSCTNEFAYGITKEGRFMAHIPKGRDGTQENKGKSVDLNIEGLLKAIIGKDENSGASADIRMQGGLILHIGRLPDGSSIDLNLGGKIKTSYKGNDDAGLARETVVGGSESKTISASKLEMIGGNDIHSVGGSHSIEATSISHNAGPGGLKRKVAGDFTSTVLGKTNMQFGLLGDITKAFGFTEKILAGIDSKTVLVGGISNTVVAGNLTNSITTGNMSNTVGAGNMSNTVGAGSYSISVGTGSLSITAGAAPVTVSSAVLVNISSTVMSSLTAPVVKIGNPALVVGGAVAGIPGPPSPHLDYITGIPILGIGTILIGLYMALDSSILTPIFLSSLVGNGIVGSGVFQLAEGLASGLSDYCKSGISVQTIDAGTLGVGTGTGIGIIVPLPVIVAAMQATFIAHGFIGPFAPLKANGISQGIVQSMILAQISTTHPTVGLGSGATILIPNPSISLSSFKGGMEGSGMKGPKVPDLAAAVSEALDISLASSIGFVVIAGPPSIVPSSGTGNGTLSLCLLTHPELF